MLWARNQEALARLGYEERRIKELDPHILPVNGFLEMAIRDVQVSLTPGSNVASDEYLKMDVPMNIMDVPMHVHDIHEQSGWSAYFSELSRKGPVIITFLDIDEVFVASPAYANGKRYQLLAGNINSADNYKMMRLDHANIPKVLPLVSGGRVHMLMEPFTPLPQKKWTPAEIKSEYPPPQSELALIAPRRTYTASQALSLLNQHVYMIRYLESQGFTGQSFNSFLWGNDLIALPNTYTTRATEAVSRHAYASAWSAAERLLHRLPYVVVTKEDEETDKLLAVLRRNTSVIKEWFSVRGKPYPPEYKLPEAKISESMAEVITEMARAATEDHHLPVFFASIEMLMALLSRGLEAAVERGLAERRVSADPPSLHETLMSVFLANLSLFVYIRTPIHLLMDHEEAMNYRKAIMWQPSILQNYQANYDKANMRSLGITTWNDKYFRADLDELTVSINMFPRSLRGLNVGRRKTMWNAKRWAIGEEEMPLELPVSRVSSISIHGVELDAVALARIFYNTPLATAVEFGSTEYDPPYLSAEDVLLIADLLEGRIMPWTLYNGLSEKAFDVLLASRSYLDLYEFPLARQAINSTFILGVPMPEQLETHRDELLHASILPFSDIPKGTQLHRLAELVNVGRN